MFVLLPVLTLLSSVSVICLLTYCKTRNLKRQEAQVNNAAARPGRGLGARRSVPSIYVIPTTNQVMQMYVQHSINTAGRSRASEQCKPPPDYGQVVEIPPTYEEAIVWTDRNAANTSQ